MSVPLEVTNKDIQQLADAPLRELIARLCRAELSDAGLPLSAVTAGGHQDASDGGIDVRVNLVGEVAGLDFIPCGSTGLQSKAEKMPASQVENEMIARGQIKPAIRELLTQGGAYVLVSSKDSCTERMLRERLAAMRKVASDAGLPTDVALDFLGADRLTDWTNRHQGVALWLREHLDGPRHGWRTYGAWAAGAADVGFMFDQQERVDAPGPCQFTTLQAVDDIRAKLRRPGQAVRLVGLSGTGKTRLVQALFEEGLGGEPLPAHLAVYCDLGDDGLQPSAAEMLHRLAASGRPQVLVVDNCNPEAHRLLVGALRNRHCPVSLLTVEYDIQGVEAEETEVYHLSTTTPELLRDLLARRDASLGHAVREQIVEMSEGNLRIALALASAVHANGDLGGLPSAELFQRLFWQRGAYDPELEHTARVLALVYSFDTREADNPANDHELARLSRLAGLAPQLLLRHLGTLVSRGLAQRRGPWRAILPQALAHRLARDGLEAVSGAQLWRELRGHPRLATSLARRLSPLHARPEAQQLVERWFAERPGLALFDEFSFQGREVFSRLATVRQDLALTRLEELTAVPGTGLLGRDGAIHRSAAQQVGAHLAYPIELFARAVEVLVRLALLDSEESSRRQSSTDDLCRLFRPRASGALASLELRLASLSALLDSTPERQRLGLLALAEALKTEWRVRPPAPFGAHARDEGWHPQSQDEWRSWYTGVLAFVVDRTGSRPEQAAALTEVVARAVPGLAYAAQVLAPLESFVSALRDQPHAWSLWQGLAVAVLQERSYADEQNSAATAVTLRRLEASIRPTALREHLEALVFVTPHGPLDVLAEEEMELLHADAAEESGAYAQTLAQLAGELAEKLHDPGMVEPWIAQFRPGYTPLLGRLTAERSSQLRADWVLLQTCYTEADPQRREVGFLRGFFDVLQQRDGALAEEVLTELAVDPGLAEFCVELHVVRPITEMGAKRLTSIANAGLASAPVFEMLKFGRTLDDIAPESHARLLRAIAALPSGVRVAVELHRMRIHGLSSSQSNLDGHAQALCADLLMQVDASFEHDADWSRVDNLVEPALGGSRGPEVAAHLNAVLIGQYAQGVPGHGAEAVMRQLFAMQPRVVLDSVSRTDDDQPVADSWFVSDRNEHPVKQIPDVILLDWAGEDAVWRDLWLAERAAVFSTKSDGFSPLAEALLERASDRALILEAFESSVVPTAWAGSYAAAAEPSVTGLTSLLAGSAPDVVEWAHAQIQRIQERMVMWERREQQHEQRFE